MRRRDKPDHRNAPAVGRLLEANDLHERGAGLLQQRRLQRLRGGPRARREREHDRVARLLLQ